MNIYTFFSLQIEDEGLDNGCSVVLVFKFDVLVNNSVVAQALHPISGYREDTDDVLSMPLLNLNSSTCNCSTFPQLSDVLFEEEDTQSQGNIASGGRNENMEPEENQNMDMEADETCTASPTDVLYCETFSLKGSTFHRDFQNVLGDCKQQMLLENGSVEIKLSKEPMNVNDENAIVVQAKVNDGFSTIGYIPGKKLKKIEAALKSNDITNVALTRVQYTYVWGAGEHKYIPSITITKKGTWLKDDKTYRYNNNFTS